MNDQGMRQGAPLYGEYPAHGVPVLGIRAEPVDRFRGERDQAPGAKNCDCTVNIVPPSHSLNAHNRKLPTGKG